MPVKVRLTRKFAEAIDGIDLSRANAGEEILVSSRDAEVLIAEGWAAPLAEAHDKPPRRRRGRRKKNVLPK